jgi:beta-galactosidase
VIAQSFGTLGHAVEREQLTKGWRFHRGALVSDTSAEWQTVRLPHDWSILEAPTKDASSAGGGGFFPTGEGIYERKIELSAEETEKENSLYFEGAYRNATVFLDGEELVKHAYGYTPFRVDLSEHVEPGRTHLLQVHVNNEPQPNSRWYSGSGLYRPVWLERRDPVHLVPESLQASTTRLSSEEAEVVVTADFVNGLETDGALEVTFTLLDANETSVASTTHSLELEAGDSDDLRVALTVPQPQAWSPESPHLYTLRTETAIDGTIRDTVETTIGLRTLTWSSQSGLLLNGEAILLRGGNVHHDHGPLGAAAFPEAEERKVRILLEAGYNAVRTAHNPPSTAFLEACDRLGMLVFNEAFDGWKSKKTDHDYGEIWEENWEKDLRAFVLRDRNHPSVIAWSVGNEVYERGNAKGIQRAHALAATVRTLDRTRPVTVGLNGLGESSDWSRLDPLFDTFEFAGYNYELSNHHASDHERRPNRIQYASESYQYEAFTNWELVQKNEYIIGDFVWSAFDYLGEAGIGRVFPPDEEARAHWEGSHFPWFGAYCGDIDIIGDRKPISHYRSLVWDEGPELYAAVRVPPPGDGEWNETLWSVTPTLASWTWPGHEGKPLTVDVYSRFDSIRVILNGALVAEAKTGHAEEYHAAVEVPYAPGDLQIEGIRNGEVVHTFALTTANEPAKIQLHVEPLAQLVENPELVFVEVSILDDRRTLCSQAAVPVAYSVNGSAEILAIGSGDVATTEPFHANPRTTYQGRSLVILRRTGEAEISLIAESEGLSGSSVSIP